PPPGDAAATGSWDTFPERSTERPPSPAGPAPVRARGALPGGRGGGPSAVGPSASGRVTARSLAEPPRESGRRLPGGGHGENARRGHGAEPGAGQPAGGEQAPADGAEERRSQCGWVTDGVDPVGRRDGLEVDEDRVASGPDGAGRRQPHPVDGDRCRVPRPQRVDQAGEVTGGELVDAARATVPRPGALVAGPGIGDLDPQARPGRRYCRGGGLERPQLCRRGPPGGQVPRDGRAGRGDGGAKPG